MLENIIYEVIKDKIDYMESVGHKDDVLKILEKEVENYCGQFTVYQLQNIDIANPYSPEYIIFYLLYKLHKQKEDNEKHIKNIEEELKDRLENSILTLSDIRDVINKK